jgi:hypothetical protein
MSNELKISVELEFGENNLDKELKDRVLNIFHNFLNVDGNFGQIDSKIGLHSQFSISPTPWHLSLATKPYLADMFIYSATGRKRYYFCKTNPEEFQAYNQTINAGIPCLPIKFTYKDGLVVLAIPEDTHPLTRLGLKDQAPVKESRLEAGTIEFFQKIGSIIRLIKERSNQLPDISLANFVLTPNSADLIVLIPPFVLNKNLDINTLATKLKGELDRLDPTINHTTQIQAMIDEFTKN